jgi:hypothetical protein
MPGTRKLSRKDTFEKGKSPGQPSVSEVSVNYVWACFYNSPEKSMHRVSCKLQLPETTISKILHKCLLIILYKFQLAQAPKPEVLASHVIQILPQDPSQD